jgi:hypothetical protein
MNRTAFPFALVALLGACSGDPFEYAAESPSELAAPDAAQPAPVPTADAADAAPDAAQPADAAPPPTDAAKPTCVTFAECQWCGNPAYASVVAVSCACRCR